MEYRHWGTSGNVFVHFHPWKTPFHWPQTPSIHGKAVFPWLPESFSVIFAAPYCGYKLPVPTTMAQSVHWLHRDSFPAMKNSLPLTTNAFHTRKSNISVTTRVSRQLIFSHFHCILTMATNFLCPLQWHRVSTDSIWMAFHLWKTTFHWSRTPSTQQHMHDICEFVVNLFHNRNIVEDSVITVQKLRANSGFLMVLA